MESIEKKYQVVLRLLGGCHALRGSKECHAEAQNFL
jgi:hypothetical protein